MTPEEEEARRKWEEEARRKWLAQQLEGLDLFKPLEGFAAGAAASQQSANAKWTRHEQSLVRLAILRVARHRQLFTTDQVWAELAGEVRVTKGMTSILLAAQAAGIIANSGALATCKRGGEHDHGQRLTVWRSLLSQERTDG